MPAVGLWAGHSATLGPSVLISEEECGEEQGGWRPLWDPLLGPCGTLRRAPILPTLASTFPPPGDPVQWHKLSGGSLEGLNRAPGGNYQPTVLNFHLQNKNDICCSPFLRGLGQQTSWLLGRFVSGVIL